MKTVLVIYTNHILNSKKEIGAKKKYSFNTNSDLKEGDLIETTEYETKLQVVKVLEQAYKYYNASTGELSDDFKSTSQWEIRTLEIREEENEIIYGKLVKFK